MKISKFLIVGFAGTLTNLIVFYYLVDISKFSPLPVSILTFFIASLQNYLFHHFWTFSKQFSPRKASIKYYLKFLSVALISLSFNLLILWLILNSYNLEIKVIAQAIGISASTFINYFGSNYWVFKKDA